MALIQMITITIKIEFLLRWIKVNFLNGFLPFVLIILVMWIYILVQYIRNRREKRTYHINDNEEIQKWVDQLEKDSGLK